MIVVGFSNLEARDAEMQTAAIREAADHIGKNTTALSNGKRRAA
jgi:hypothetical protein